jgi:hypothetical protein
MKLRIVTAIVFTSLAIVLAVLVPFDKGTAA